MMRLAFYIRESWEIDRRHVPPISKAVRGSGGIEKGTSLRTQRKRVLSEDLLNWQTCRGHAASPPKNLTFRGVAARLGEPGFKTQNIFVFRDAGKLGMSPIRIEGRIIPIETCGVLRCSN